eukprot:CAMPEP_0117428894 /NCGR_PEP_ID=MMETSP0758-20121206/8504_1 /TAXON_ID=63605 /ORGANISM="Percolomonas cosmopolitus, Strain AE-1 (ATCC 50343)" /LENGTH=188 /DNA_ID=CAMNT_0005215511 /DNA_START=25 /DNA_END=588 /DNA_ORIENTATION=+
MNNTAQKRRLVATDKLQKLLNEVDPRHTLDPEVEDILLELADRFIDSVTHMTCKIAQHRQASPADIKDMKLHLEKNLGLHVKGFAQPIKTTTPYGSTPLDPLQQPVVSRDHLENMKKVMEAQERDNSDLKQESSSTTPPLNHELPSPHVASTAELASETLTAPSLIGQTTSPSTENSTPSTTSSSSGS